MTTTKRKYPTVLRNQYRVCLTEDDIKYMGNDDLLSRDKLKNISCVVFPTIGDNPAHIKFWNDYIYEFKIDYYKTGILDTNGFFEYAKVEYDPENNNYKIYGYYCYEGKFRPTAPTRKGEYDIIELDTDLGGMNKFKGPKFTEGPRKGTNDTWILNTSVMFPIIEQ